jgi:hypothetical protein
MVRAGALAGIFDKLEPEPHKNGPLRNTAQKYGLKSKPFKAGAA